MYDQTLLENEKKRIDYPLSRLICFVMFMIWQMGVIYYTGPALNIDGRTPLPIDMDNITAIIAIGYILNIVWLILFPKKFIYAARAAVVIAFISVLGLFLPLSEEMLAVLIYIQCFSCCFMIGFEASTMIYVFTEKTTILHLLVAYPIGYIVVSILQNDIFKLPFTYFRFGIVFMLILLIYFYFKLPTNTFPSLLKKKDGALYSKHLFIGVYILTFLACLLAVIGPSAVASIKNGVSTLYIFAAVGGISAYFIYKKYNVHPIKTVSFEIMLGAIGFLLLFLSLKIPFLSLPACAFMGIGLIPCALLPLYGLILMKQYPRRSIPVVIMTLAIISALISSSILEMFRNDIELLYLTHLAIVIIMAFIYLFTSPFMLMSLHKKITQEPSKGSELPEFLSALTERELEVADLIGHGYSNRDISKMLFISEHTVKDHTKNIYRKLDIHSRYELTAMLSKHKHSQ